MPRKLPLLLRTLFVIVIFLLAIQLSAKNAKAEGEFTTNYQVAYKIHENGQTDVVEKITLINNNANYYADKFELKIGSTKVTNVKAQDNVGPMAADVRFENNTTIISVKFNEKVIGRGKTLAWSLNYSSTELTTKSGQIWEVSIPRLAKSSDIGTYQAQVIVPMTLGPNAFVYPAPTSEEKNGIEDIFTYNKDGLQSSGISMSFGQKQVFQYDLNYYIENQSLTTQIQSIALPPDNNFQKVVISEINPPPTDVTVDKDGNFLAKYRLSPKEGKEIKVKGYIEVFSKPFRNIDQKLTSDDRKLYTSPQRYWEVDTSTIKDKAKDLNSPRKIYDYVTSVLSYNEQKLQQSQIERLGAVSALNNPKDAVCMEFTDLFIALARASGIPARGVVGYAYTQNTRLRPLSFAAQGDLLHAWPEYWDDARGWVQVDPTWGTTSGGLDYFNKLDFNHVTLVVRGASSIYPYPAGSYKKSANALGRDVIVNFAQTLPEITATPEVDVQIPDRIISGFPIKLTARIRNIGTSSIFTSKATLESQLLKINYGAEKEVGTLPPFAQRVVDFSLQSKAVLSPVNDRITFTFGDVQISKPVVIIPFYYLVLSPVFALTLALSTIIIVFGLLLYNRLLKKKLIFKRHIK